MNRFKLPCILFLTSLVFNSSSVGAMNHKHHIVKLYVPVHAPKISYYAVVKYVHPDTPTVFFHFWYSNGRWTKKPGEKLVLSSNPQIARSQKVLYRSRYFDGTYPGLVWVRNPYGYAAPAEMSDMYTLSRMYHIHGAAYVTRKYHPHMDQFIPTIYKYPQETYPFNGQCLYGVNQIPFVKNGFILQPSGTATVAGRLCIVFQSSGIKWYEDAKTHIILKYEDDSTPNMLMLYEVTYIKYHSSLPASIFELPKGTKVWIPAIYEGLRLPKGITAVKMPSDIASTGMG